MRCTLHAQWPSTNVTIKFTASILISQVAVRTASSVVARGSVRASPGHSAGPESEETPVRWPLDRRRGGGYWRRLPPAFCAKIGRALLRRPGRPRAVRSRCPARGRRRDTISADVRTQAERRWHSLTAGGVGVVLREARPMRHGLNAWAWCALLLLMLVVER